MQSVLVRPCSWYGKAEAIHASLCRTPLCSNILDLLPQSGGIAHPGMQCLHYEACTRVMFAHAHTHHKSAMLTCKRTNPPWSQSHQSYLLYGDELGSVTILTFLKPTTALFNVLATKDSTLTYNVCHQLSA